MSLDYLNELQKFQAFNLRYRFNNITLLKDALIYPIENGKSTTFHRFRVLGNAVLKLVSSEYTVQSSGLVDLGILTSKREALLNISSGQTPIAIKLFGHVGRDDCSHPVLKISRDLLGNPTLTEVPYHKFLQAIFGAVFLDAGGSKGGGIEECLKIFVNLRVNFYSKIKYPELASCFPVHQAIKEYWIRMGMNLNFEFVAQDTFDVRFTNSDLLCEALVHKTFYDVIRNDRAYLRLHMPNYERLKFLGETVLGLIVTEFAYRKYPNADALIIYEQANNPVKKDHLMEVAERLGIRKWGLVRTQKSEVFGNYDDILEAVIGAIYVDSLEDITRQFILREFQLQKDKVWNIGISALKMQEQMDSFYTEGEWFYTKQRLQRYGMLHEICYN